MKVIPIFEVVKALVLAVKKSTTRQVTRATLPVASINGNGAMIAITRRSCNLICCELEHDNVVHVVFLFCDVCKHYKDSIALSRNCWYYQSSC